MSTYNAAYCSSCRRYVLVSIDGGCEFGHPRSSLRGIYSAQIERRTGRPKPPTAEQMVSLSRVTAPVAPIALPIEIAPEALRALELRPDVPGPVLSGDSQVAPHSLTAPLAPVISAVGSEAMARTLVAADMHGILARLFGPPRGRHSSSSLGFGAPRGRHSAKPSGPTSGRVSTRLVIALAVVAAAGVGVAILL